MIKLWDEDETNTLKSKIRELGNQEDKCLFNSAKAEEIYFNENDRETFHVSYFDSVNTLLNLPLHGAETDLG